MNWLFSEETPRRTTCPRNVIWRMLALAVLLLPGIVGCQMPASNSAALDDVLSRIKKIADEMATKQDVAAVQGDKRGGASAVERPRGPVGSEG